ncbi:MAG: hypothetical protein R3A49_09770 [Acidimicrobiia bacterium]
MTVNRRGRRLVMLSALVVSLTLTFAAVPAGAATPEDLNDRTEADIRNALGQVGAIVDGLKGQAKNDVNAAVAQLAAGNASGAQEILHDLGTEAECAAIEAATRYVGFDPDAITVDVPSGQAYATIDVQNASDGTPCQFKAPVSFFTVSYGITMGGWGVFGQWRHDTDEVAVTGSGSYTMAVGLPRPNADPAAFEAAADVTINGAPGEPLSDPATGVLNVAADGLTGVLGDFVGSLSPAQISGLLDFICPAQVDVGLGSAADVPQTLAGGYANIDMPTPDMSVLDVVDGVFVDPAAINAAGRGPGQAAAKSLGASATGGGLDLGGLDLATLDLGGLFAALCTNPEPPTDVAGIQIENAGTPTDTGVDVLGVQTIPRTGSNAPGLTTVGIALIVAGWLVLTGNAISRARNRRLNRA